MCTSRQAMRTQTLALHVSCSLVLLAACNDGVEPFDPGAEPFTPKGMIYVPAGDFTMGSSQDGEQLGTGEFTVYLDEFYIDRHEVTIADYDAFLQVIDMELILVAECGDPQPCARNYNPEHPANCVTWYEAREYCQWVDRSVKRLPTEAEWEKAARGPYGRIFPWGDVADDEQTSSTLGTNDQSTGNETHDCYDCGSEPLLISCGAIHVGADEIDVSLYGVEGMVSGPIEWAQDYYSLYSDDDLDNPTGPTTGESKVLRGNTAGACSFSSLVPPPRASLRERTQPCTRSQEVGFRCVMPRTEPKW